MSRRPRALNIAVYRFIVNTGFDLFAIISLLYDCAWTKQAEAPHVQAIAAVPERRIRRGGGRIWAHHLGHLGRHHSRRQERRREAGRYLHPSAERALIKRLRTSITGSSKCHGRALPGH